MTTQTQKSRSRGSTPRSGKQTGPEGPTNYNPIMGCQKGIVNMLKLNMRLKNETKTCFRFERRDDAGNLITLYLKKTDVTQAGIDPKKGITVTVEEGNENV